MLEDGACVLFYLYTNDPIPLRHASNKDKTREARFSFYPNSLQKT